MTTRSRAAAAVVTAICVCYGVGSRGRAQTPSPPTIVRKGLAMMATASGTFDVKLAPQPAVEKVGDPTVGRMSIDKQFHGDLAATSKGEMLAAMTDVKESAGYVAMERVNGTLHGRNGTFVLQHSGTVTRGQPLLVVTVVPDAHPTMRTYDSDIMNEIAIIGGRAIAILERRV